MTEKLFLQKTGSGFFPRDAYNEAIAQSMTDGHYRCTKVSERSYKQLSKFFATVKDIYESTDAADRFVDEEDLREELLICAGWRQKHSRMDGTSHWKARSISYKDADHDKFQVIFDRAIDVACSEWGIDKEELMR